MCYKYFYIFFLIGSLIISSISCYGAIGDWDGFRVHVHKKSLFNFFPLSGNPLNSTAEVPSLSLSDNIFLSIKANTKQGSGPSPAIPLHFTKRYFKKALSQKHHHPKKTTTHKRKKEERASANKASATGV